MDDSLIAGPDSVQYTVQGRRADSSGPLGDLYRELRRGPGRRNDGDSQGRRVRGDAKATEDGRAVQKVLPNGNGNARRSKARRSSGRSDLVTDSSSGRSIDRHATLLSLMGRVRPLTSGTHPTKLRPAIVERQEQSVPKLLRRLAKSCKSTSPSPSRSPSDGSPGEPKWARRVARSAKRLTEQLQSISPWQPAQTVRDV